MAKSAPKPPAPPKLPTKDDLLAAAERQAQARDQGEEEDSPVAQIRSHLGEIEDLLDQIDGEGEG